MSSSPKISPAEFSSPAKPSRSRAPISSSPCSDRSAFAIPCHLPSAKNPVSLITSASTRSGCSQAQARPTKAPQSWTTSATGPGSSVSIQSPKRSRLCSNVAEPNSVESPSA